MHLIVQAVLPELNVKAWNRNREQCIRLAVQHIEGMMKTHLEFLSDMVCHHAHQLPAAHLEFLSDMELLLL
jgi:hypothetical protein